MTELKGRLGGQLSALRSADYRLSEFAIFKLQTLKNCLLVSFL